MKLHGQESNFKVEIESMNQKMKEIDQIKIDAEIKLDQVNEKLIQCR